MTTSVGAPPSLTRSFADSSRLQRFVGFLAASFFSVAFLVAPFCLLGVLCNLALHPLSRTAWLWALPLLFSLLLPDAVTRLLGRFVLRSYPLRCIPFYFRYSEYLEISDAELKSLGRNVILAQHPHGVISFCSICAGIVTVNAPDGIGPSLASDCPVAVASVVKLFPFLKDVLSIFGILAADKKALLRRLSRPKAKGGGSICLIPGGIAELFLADPRQETIYLRRRFGFVALALRSGADLVPVYLFGNTSVLSAWTSGPLAALSRSLGASLTFFWGLWGMPLPRPSPMMYVRGRPLGLPHLAEPTAAEVEHWHGVYCQKLEELFERYKAANPDYAHKRLKIY